MGKATRKISRLTKLGALSSKISGSYLSQKYEVRFNHKKETEDLSKTHLKMQKEL